MRAVIIITKPAKSALDCFLEELSPSEAPKVREATEHIANFTNNKLQSGNLMIMLCNRLGTEVFRRYVREVLDKDRIMSESNVGLWMKRAKILSERVPNELVRKYLLQISGGHNVVVRHEPAEENKKAGVKCQYDLSTFLLQAMEQEPLPKGKLNDNLAKNYVRRVIDLAAQLRSEARR
jgi:hypothetical protein